SRDTVERQVELAGIPLEVIDTAGFHDTRDEVEKLGIARAWAAVERADLALLIVDARDAIDMLSAADAALLATLPASLPRVVVHNKSDLAKLALHAETHRVGEALRRHICPSPLP